MKRFAGIILFVALPLCLHAQGADADVAKYMTMVENGQADAVKGEIPALLAKYPNNPGVLYLQGLTTTEAAEAVRVYQSIVDNFPASEWADDALYKVYQFYYSLGLYRTAEIKIVQLRKNYPKSKYANAVVTETKQLADDAAPAPPPPVAPATVTTTVTTAPPVMKTQSAEDRFTLQVGAYTTSANAEKQKSLFVELGYPVEVINRVKEGRSLFLVLVGTFASADEARERGSEIKKKHNIDSIVTTK